MSCVDQPLQCLDRSVFHNMDNAEKRMQNLDFKWCELEWYARLKKTRPKTRSAAYNMGRARFKYPEECKLIDANPEYYLGFYKAARATARLLLPNMLPENYCDESVDEEHSVELITEETLPLDVVAYYCEVPEEFF